MSIKFFRPKTITLAAALVTAASYFGGFDGERSEPAPAASLSQTQPTESPAQRAPASLASVTPESSSPAQEPREEDLGGGRSPAFVQNEEAEESFENSDSPDFFRDGKLDLNLAYILEKDPQFLAQNPRVAELVGSGRKVTAEDIQIPPGFRLSFRVEPACAHRLDELFVVEDIDENARNLLAQGVAAYVAARARGGLNGAELSAALQAESCVSAAGADLQEEVGAVSFNREPLTSSSRQRGYQIMRNAGLVDLFSQISYATFGSATVTLAVIDSGVNTSHADLRGVSSGARDDFGHGTMVAGTAAAPSNGVGTMGSMPFHVRISSYKVNDPGKGTAYSSSISNGITRAAYEGADVINVSWSGFTKGSYNRAVATAVARGALVTGSAGNYSLRVSTNVTIRGAISVGSLNGTDNRMASYSNYGNGVEIYTPGTYMTTTRNGGYTLASGTSFAAPLVGGIGLMAKAYAKSRGRSISPASIEEIILQTSRYVSTQRGSVKKLQPLAVFQRLQRMY